MKFIELLDIVAKVMARITAALIVGWGALTFALVLIQFVGMLIRL